MLHLPCPCTHFPFPLLPPTPECRHFNPHCNLHPPLQASDDHSWGGGVRQAGGGHGTVTPVVTPSHVDF